LDTLALIAQKPAPDIAADLWEAIAEGLVLLLSRSYQFSESSDEEIITAEYKFAHDQIQQAIYSLIPVADRPALHWRIGQLLLRHTLPDKRLERIFDLVNQLNLGRVVCVERVEWDELAELNLLAGQKAKDAAAYQSALTYLTIGIELIHRSQSPLIKSSEAPDSWERQYKLSLQLYLAALEVAYLNTNFEQMETYAENVLQHAKNLLDKIKVYEVRMLAYIAQNRLDDVLSTALPVLKLLAVRFPTEPSPADIGLALEEIKLALAGRPAEELIGLPEMTEVYRLAAMRLLSIVSSAAYFGAPTLLPILVFKMVALSVKHGNAPESALAYAMYGLILCGQIGDVEAGYKFGQLALKLLEKLKTREHKAKTMAIVLMFINHWKAPIRQSLGPLLEAHHSALETGDLEYAARSIFVHSLHSFLAGRELAELNQEIVAQRELLNQLKQAQVFQVNELYGRAITILAGASDTATAPLDRQRSGLAGAGQGNLVDLLEDWPHFETQDKSLFFNLYFNKLILCYLFGHYHKAVELANLARGYLDSSMAMFSEPVFHFYDSLARLALFLETSELDGVGLPNFLEPVAANQQKLKSWAAHAPMNHLHKYYLVEAEYAHAFGQDGAAREYYDQAITLAQQHQYLNEEALANELAARFYLAREQTEIAIIYLQKAHYAYSQWGAWRKVKELEKSYPQLLAKIQARQLDPKSTTHLAATVQTTSSGLSSLDLRSVLKATQIISSEIVLSNLLSKMMKIVIENAGAQKGYLLLEKNNIWSIEASGAISQDDIAVVQSVPLTVAAQGQHPILPGAVVNYVIYSLQHIVLNEATREGQFTNDPYILATQPKSILCMPLLTQGKLIGILYLENNLATGAFTPQRLEVLNLLSAQAAISIENARFYTHQIELTRAYSRFVPREILFFLKKTSITEVKLGDQTQREMTVLFSDIRSFTSLSEQMTPQENFNFINAYLSRVSPIIREYNGYIDKYMGDAIMALFPQNPDDAVQAAIAMQQAVAHYNIERVNAGSPPIKIGIGLHTGRVMLGTIGEAERMEGTVISDAVNLAARLEGLSKVYGSSIIISGEMMFSLDNPGQYSFRFLDKVKVKGKEEAVSVFEILNGEPEDLVALKLKAQDHFERGLLHYHSQEFPQAQEQFQQALAINPHDQAAQLYLRRVEHFIEYGTPVDWEGVTALEEK
jgi:class 3 adenylate cyclase